jgi:uncharacterized protein (DUF433 family)
MATARHIESVYVESRPGVCGGAPVIRGTRFPVRSVAVYVLRQGMTAEEMVREWDTLTLAQIHGALAFYYDHKDEVDRDIEENSRPAVPPSSSTARS